MGKIINLQEAIRISKELRGQDKTVVLAGGCFDVFHKGHLVYLENAKKQGDRLFVLLESDENVRRLKGESRPVNLQKERGGRLAKLGFLDYVVLLPPLTGDKEYFEVTKKLLPNVIAITEGDPKSLEKEMQAKKVGGKAVIATRYLTDYSTTALLSEKMKRRVFVAIDFPEKVKEDFAVFFQNIGHIGEIKWEKSEKLHLTLAFLGYIDGERIKELTPILSSIGVGKKQLTLSIIPKLSGFPTTGNPRVLWLPLEGDIIRLGEIADRLQKMLKDKGFKLNEREFTAHLTIGRFRDGVGKNIKEKIIKETIKYIPKKPNSFEVNGLTLFESKLTPKGSIYEILAHENFRD